MKISKDNIVQIVLVFGCAFLLSGTNSCAQTSANVQVQEEFPDPSLITVKGLLGDAADASRKARLLSLPTWDDGKLIQIFSKEARSHHNTTDWYGEHAGKWLYTAAIAARQSGDDQLKALLLHTADKLVASQEADGYLGTYSPAVRLTNASAPQDRSWDVWTLSYMTLGLLEVNRYFPEKRYLDAAKAIGELFIRTFGPGKHDITEYGTRHGISATIALDPVVELYKSTRDGRYLELAENIVHDMEARDGLRLVSVALQGNDMENVGDGKAYQIIWNLTGLIKLYEITGDADYLKAVKNAWQNIDDYHLTIAGGPWGGIGKHKECFNTKNFWSPYGFIETCSTMSWIQLNKQMLRLTGEARYAQELEKSAYNALLGAQFPDGEEWCYHSFSNGSENSAHFDDCCPSSGAMALEEIVSGVYGMKAGGIALNIFTPGTADLELNHNHVHLDQRTNYPFDGHITLTVSPSSRVNFPLFIRIPDWEQDAMIMVNGDTVKVSDVHAGEFFRIDRQWRKNDVVTIEFPFPLEMHRRREVATRPQGGPDLYDVDWFAVSRGPLIYAVRGLINGSDREHVFTLPPDSWPKLFSPATAAGTSIKNGYEFRAPGQQPLLFLPYFEADGRKPGGWRLTWIQDSIE